MSHVRQQIRDAAVALLTGATSAGANVWSNRANALRPELMPAITVGTPEELASPLNLGSSTAREVRLEIAIFATQMSGGDDALDSLAVEVEELMATPGLGIAGASADYESASLTLDDLGAGEVGVLRLVYRVLAQTSGPETFI